MWVNQEIKLPKSSNHTGRWKEKFFNTIVCHCSFTLLFLRSALPYTIEGQSDKEFPIVGPTSAVVVS